MGSAGGEGRQSKWKIGGVDEHKGTVMERETRRARTRRKRIKAGRSRE